MSILETFYILFKSDASDVKKGAEEAEKSTKKLDESLKNVGKSTEKVGASFLQLAKSAASFFAVAAATRAVVQGITQANDYALKLGDASRALGVNAKELDAWGNAVQRTGGTAEGFQGSLKGLASHFGTTANIALKALPQLADVFQRLGRFRALQYGKILGLDEATILLLQQGRREVESVISRQKELGTVSQKNIEIAQKYRIANLELDSSFRGLYLELQQTIVPILTKFYNTLVPIIEYLRKHKDLVIGAFIGIGIAAGIMLAPFIVAAAPILATAAAIGAVIALFAIAYEDLQAFRAGHNSLIGDLIKRWSDAKTAIGDALKYLTKLLFLFLDPMQTVTKSFDFLSGLASGKSLIGQASNSPIASQSSSSIFNSRSSARNNNVNTGPITVHTQASDAVGISKGLGKGIREHLWQANNEFADGVSY
jgi:hypothetical protein